MIKLQDLSYGYYRSHNVLKDITMELPKGHIYGLLGKNGVGKSTLLKVITGALTGKGSYTLAGFNPRERQADMQQIFRLVPEQEALYPMTPQELADITAPLYPNFSQDVFHEALQEFEVPLNQRMTEMSLGQQKKALISLAFACQTPYLFLDEPTNGMDIPSKASFRRICAANMDEQKTIIISTHQVDDLENLIDAVVIMNNDGVLMNNTLENIAKRYSFGPVDPNDPDVLYSEPTLRGLMGITPNTTGQEGIVDVKILFTAVVKKMII